MKNADISKVLESIQNQFEKLEDADLVTADFETT